MIDSCKIRLSDAQKTKFCGKSLSLSIYGLPLTILLKGELGAGKTTFLQGFAEGLGIKEQITSPTYALEQRYKSGSGSVFRFGPSSRPSGGFGEVEMLHLDLYRLSDKEAQNLVENTDDHEGIRCIEWSEKLGEIHNPHIEISLEDSNNSGRTLHCKFHDIPLPSRETVEQWRREVYLPKNIAQHCDLVADVTDRLTESLLQQGHIVRPFLLRRSAELHDLLRFVDFNEEILEKEDNGVQWRTLQKQFSGLSHERAAQAFLSQRGFDAVGEVVSRHGSDVLTTVEQRLLFYADKRVCHEKIVTIEERFRDLSQRYWGGKISPEKQRLFELGLQIEQELFPNGVPI